MFFSGFNFRPASHLCFVCWQFENFLPYRYYQRKNETSISLSLGKNSQEVFLYAVFVNQQQSITYYLSRKEDSGNNEKHTR